MSAIRVDELTELSDVKTLEPMLRAYITFVTDALRDYAEVTFDPDVLMQNTLSKLDGVVPPKGRTFIARQGDATVGMVFLRQSGPDAMEIKRLYVDPSARGTGTGRRLVDVTIDAARRAGASALRLDTTKNLTAAIALYESLGFVFRDVYAESDHADDDVLLPHLVFMEKRFI